MAKLKFVKNNVADNNKRKQIALKSETIKNKETALIWFLFVI